MLGKQFTLSQTQPKSQGGLGLKKFSLMNQAMLAKQYWGTNHNQNSLLARTFMAKYFSRGSIQNCSPKLHQSWFWRSIIKFDNPKLIGGRWWIGKGNTIPLTHQDWIKTQPHNLNNPNLASGIVADLIHQNTNTWRVDLVRTIYPYPQCADIL